MKRVLNFWSFCLPRAERAGMWTQACVYAECGNQSFGRAPHQLSHIPQPTYFHYHFFLKTCILLLTTCIQCWHYFPWYEIRVCVFACGCWWGAEEDVGLPKDGIIGSWTWQLSSRSLEDIHVPNRWAIPLDCFLISNFSISSWNLPKAKGWSPGQSRELFSYWLLSGN